MRRSGVVFLIVLLAPTFQAMTHAQELPPVFPAPVKIARLPGVLAVNRDVRINAWQTDEGLLSVAQYLSEELGKALDAPGARLPIVHQPVLDERAGEVALRTLTADEAKRLGLDRPGAYSLRVNARTADVAGRDPSGCFYGALTLLQLFGKTGEGTGQVPAVTVTDFPYHKYRGMRSKLPRGKPRAGEITHDEYRNLLRLMAFCRLNHVWVEGCSWNTPMRRHPETAWQDVLTRDQARDIVAFARRHFLSMDGSLDWQWVYHKHKHLAELEEGETWDDMAKKVRRVSRVNVCPSRPETWKMLFETMEDVMETLPGDHFAVSLDEMYQDYHGARWAVCPLCKDKDPVKLWADMASRLTAKVLEHEKTPILGGGMLMYEHQGWFKDIYKAIDLVENRDRIVIYNWSEGHIRRGAMRVKGKRLQNPTFSATPFFKKHGYRDVLHLFAGTRWNGRPEMREVKGKLDCYGGFVSYYHPLNYAAMKDRGTVARLIFTAQHLWSPDAPAMDSPEDRRMCRYGEAVADAIAHGRSTIEAVAIGRKAYAAPEGTRILTGGALGRPFASRDAPVSLLGAARGERTEGTMRIVLPIEEANPHEAYLALTMYDWDQAGEGEIWLNGHAVTLATSRLSNGRDYAFPPVRIPPEWLTFGPEPNVVRFVYKRTAGFIVKKAEIILADAPAPD